MAPEPTSGISPTLLRAVLDPGVAASEREARRRRYYLNRLPRTRAFGFLVLVVSAFLHVALIPGSGTFRGVFLYTLVAGTYCLGIWPLSRAWVERKGTFALPSFWYATDPLLWNGALLVTGAESSWLFPALIIGVASHAAINSELVLAIGLGTGVAYGAVLGLHHGASWAAFPWGQEFTKLVIYACAVGYLHMVSREVGAIRKERENLFKISRTINQELKRQTEELALAKQAAEEHDKAKSLFLANMSHELRTPLNAIILYSELIEGEAGEGVDNPLKEDAHRILGAGHQLLALVNDLLDLSKIEAGHMTFRYETIFLPDLIRELDTAVKGLVAQRGNQLVVEDRCTGVAGVELCTDPVRLRQILVNLLGNAAKFTEAGTISFRILPAPEAWMTFEVEDTGIGMTEEQTRKIFQDFIQGDMTTSVKYGGTGLGLALSRRLCERMGGRIEVVSSFGDGSLFRVVMPLTPPSGPKGIPLPDAAPSPAQPDAPDAGEGPHRA